MDRQAFQIILNYLSDGVILMDEQRSIYYLNQKAKDLTGWHIGGLVPYCSYCRIREVQPGEQRCILALDNPLPLFQAHMPTYEGVDESLEMSSSRIEIEEESYIILTVRDPKWNMEKEKNKIKRLLVHDTLRAQEETQKRLTQELHDHIGQSVYSVFLGLQGLKGATINDRYQKHLQLLDHTLQQTMEDIKRLSKQLRPVIIDQLGIKQALQDSVKDWEYIYKIAIALHIEDIAMIDKEKELHIYRIIQEAVRNAVKHGQATAIDISFKVEADTLYFKIEDNGKGFNVLASKKNGFGLYHMIERMEMIGGKIDWESNIGEGTKVIGSIKLKEN